MNSTIAQGDIYMSNLEDLGLFIKRQLQIKKYTINKLAKKADVDAGYLSRLIRGEKNKPSAEVLAKIADALGAPRIDVFRAAGYIEPEPDEDLQNKFPLLADIDPELLQRFAVAVKEDPYQMLMFDDILSAGKEEREQIVRDWLELRKKYKNKPKEEPPEDNGPSAWDIIRNNKK